MVLMLSIDERTKLLNMASQAVTCAAEYHQQIALPAENYSKTLLEHRATFVTLTKFGQLRGCMGALDAIESLVQNVMRNGFNAARRDPRFDPVAIGELDDIDIDISVLSPPVRLEVKSESELLDRLRPGVDGLILEDGACRATYLPSVWDQLPDSSDFVRQLKLKAGLPASYWSPVMQCSVYTTEYFGAAMLK